MSQLVQYPYLLANLIGLPVVIIFFAFVRSQRLLMLLSGAVLALGSPIAIIYQGEYWSPRRIAGGAWGIEDVLFCFSLGSVIWLSSTYFLQRKIKICIQLKIFLTRIFVLFLLAVIENLILSFLGVTGAVIPIISYLLAALVILTFRRDLWLLPMFSVPICTTLYLSVFALMPWVSPEFIGMWNGNTLWGPRLFGFPVEEYVWIISLSASYPLLFAYAADAQIVSDR